MSDSVHEAGFCLGRYSHEMCARAKNLAVDTPRSGWSARDQL